ncbi:ubiquitin-conjugating enzyme/RWD-like protein [Pseudomassariella vexata]|uniref:Ubiquitin-conjugating enzyme E2 2 n=1 Tax=Pseudomassariella vexata TaxID=1141098 RepID=A0A1Y2EJN9_9PEZI|nr:ubiquitin-conjugating enzyme/RWD-like protein [Pseudomassariella vexata]ORY71717.1 ubiquitin-conjugating enzyme/RWD-like protein [Pseudomassariella vexata]
MSSSRQHNGKGAKTRLMSEMKELDKEKWVNIDVVNDNILRWRVGLIVVNPESAFNGGYFKAEMTFTDEYPYEPPTFRFLIPIYHPNIYPDGKLCISILHTPGEDIMSGEQASERWTPLQGVESVLRSVLLLLDDPEINSPANVDAGVMFRDDRFAYNKRAAEIVEKSKKDVPEGFIMPTTLVDAPPPKVVDDDAAFWDESDEELDFGGSDTGDDEDMADFDEDGEDEDGASEDEESPA